MGRLDQKIAVITGGCSGIGLATAELFVAEGAHVVVGDVQDATGTQLAKRIGEQFHYRHCDVTQADDIQALLRFAEETFGGLDILFNNAGAGGTRARIDEFEATDWDFTQALLLRSVALGIRYAAPLMQKRGGGAIVNTASVAALIAGAAPVAYSVAKAGVLQLTKVSAAQLARFNIRVNAICPGLIATGIYASSFGLQGEAASRVEEFMRNKGADSQPIAKPGLPADIAQACLYLASSESAFVTGTHLVVDGGMTVGPRSSWDPSAPTIGAELEALLKS